MGSTGGRAPGRAPVGAAKVGAAKMRAKKFLVVVELAMAAGWEMDGERVADCSVMSMGRV